MKRFGYILLVLIAIGAVLYGMYRSPRFAGPASKIRNAVQKFTERNPKWTPERIAQDPEGYLVYAGGFVDKQIEQRKEKLRSTRARKTEIESKALSFSQNLKDVENFAVRLDSARQKAEDENRWPVQVAGKSIDRESALQILSSSRQYIDEHRPLANAYVDAMQRLTSAQKSMESDIERLGSLGDKIAMDLERVRLNKGVEELTEIKQTEAELSSLSGVLADMTTDPIAGVVLPGATSQANLDIEQLVRKQTGKDK